MLISRPLTAILLAVLLLLGNGASAPVQALLASHDCSYCHNLHGGFSTTALLKYSSTEALCLSCHSVKINDTQAVAVHNPLNLASNQLGYITCRECHDPHDNVGGNIHLVGYKYDPSTGRRFSVPNIREELPTSNPALPVYRQVTFQSSADFNIDGIYPGPGACQICHSPNHNAGQNCSGCHAHEAEFAASGSCTACHNGLGSGALAVGPDSPHSEIITGYSCSECHSGHGSAGTVVIPNNPAVGINYSANGETGIALGSTTVTGATEAEICWNCHAIHGISEWGTNTDSNGSFPNFDFGSLSGAIAPAWVNAAGTLGATWTSASFSYKTAAIQSTHAVDGSAAAPGLDPLEKIRCSYCHDVHDLNLAPYDTASGKPYLRGSWVGNPYREDGAPSNNPAGGKPGDVANYSAYDVAGKFGAVPRGGPTYTALGGYFIDQNSSDPTATPAMDSPDKFAGICRLCHEGTAGTGGDGLWQAAEIDSLNKFGTPGDDWVGNNNGHAAVVKGGSGIGAVNLFTSAKRHQTAWSPYSGNGTQRGNPVMAYRNARSYNKGAWVTSLWAQGLRGTDSTAFRYPPRVDTATRQYNYGVYSWGATVVSENANGTMTDSGIDSSFHQFTCSKCHNPHASRLPRLLITNCLDTSHNTWDDSYLTPNEPLLSVENRSVTLSQVTSAQNCHRLADPAYAQARPQGTTTGGWNRVSPW